MALTNEDLAAISQLLDSRLQPLKDDLESVKSKIEELDERLTSIESAKNVTNKNIMILAEGHYDLSKKLSTALKCSGETEMLAIKVNIHDDEIRKIKERLAIA